jgi:hypothetical protein
MNKTIGSMPLWQFILVLVSVLAVFTLVVRAYQQRKTAAAAA